MEKDIENLQTTSEKLEKPLRDEYGRLLPNQPSLNPNGRPKGSNNFKTDWENFIKKVAKSDNITPEEINEQLLAVGLKKAKEGDYAFYRDIHDRVYGKPLQTVEQEIDHKGLSINFDSSFKKNE